MLSHLTELTRTKVIFLNHHVKKGWLPYICTQTETCLVWVSSWRLRNIWRGGDLSTWIWNTHKDYYIPHTCITFVTKYKQPDLPTVPHECTAFIPQAFLWKGRERFTAFWVGSEAVMHIQGVSNMTGTDLCVNKPHCAAAVWPWECEATNSTLPPARVSSVWELLEWWVNRRYRGAWNNTLWSNSSEKTSRPTTVWGRVSLTDLCVWVV